MVDFEIVSLNYKLIDENSFAFFKVVKHHKKKYKIVGKVVGKGNNNYQQKVDEISEISKTEMSKLIIDLTKNNFTPRLKNQQDSILYVEINENLNDEELQNLKENIEKKLGDRLENSSFGEITKIEITDKILSFDVRYFNMDETIKIILTEMKRKLILENTKIAKRIYTNENKFLLEFLYPYNFGV